MSKVATVKTLIAAQLEELIFKSNAENVLIGDQTLAEFLADYITGAQVDAKIAALVGAAPETLDTLKEIADALSADDTALGELTTALEGKVSVVEGKGLSANDFTTTLKEKLEGLSNYTHPESHSAEMITETDDKKFVTGAEKTKLQTMGRVLISETQPEDMVAGDVWIQPQTEESSEE
jgi:prophage DNA circulation protein